jgi:hypothetical protein
LKEREIRNLVALRTAASMTRIIARVVNLTTSAESARR